MTKKDTGILGKAKNMVASVTNNDGWYNLLASLGGGNDRTTNTSFTGSAVLSQAELEQLYIFNGLAKRIVELPSFEMTRNWIEIENDTDNVGLQALDAINAKQLMRELVKYGRLYGGAICIMGIDDGNLLEVPVNEKGIRSVEWLRVYDRHQLSWTSSDVNDNPESEFYGEPEFYTVNAYTTGSSFRVHRSRILTHVGTDVPERTRVQNQGWGGSVLQAIYEELRNYGLLKSSSVSIVQDFVQTLLQIDNLSEMVANGQEDIIKKRLNIIDLSRSINNTILLDKEESYTKSASSVAGLDALIVQGAVALSAVTGIPFTKLFGQSPGGLNATGESDIRNFYDEISGAQEKELLPQLQKLHRYIMLSRDGGYKGTINKDAKICFNALWQLSDKEDAEWKLNIAKTDEIYIKNAVVSPEEVAVSRFDGGFNKDTEVDFSNRNVSLTPDEK